MDEYYEVDIFVCGQYVGRRKIGLNSIVGLLLAGNYAQGAQQASDMIAHLEKQIAANAPADAGSPPASSPSADPDSA
ncbi:MAG: hypothetical protein H6636_06855 [Anaerolineales bacterium]|nr:hypothetical protein [Anaerolineales bacterium]